MAKQNVLAHEKIDALVTSIIGWCQSAFTRTPQENSDEIAFTDEWERKQIARELHWN